ncbi:hypothetical protein ABZ352_18755 [Streptomyces griseofuscus]|uniref:hypothetical protein n=1 Tax=Streptomyces griseofuscus TaxID=146922 RepID=UPI0033EED6BA
MSNRTERDAIGELLLKEWKDFAEVLADRGETWATTDPMTWPRDSTLWWLDHGIRRLLDAAAVVGLKLTREELERQHQERAEYRRLFPNGAPTLTNG